MDMANFLTRHFTSTQMPLNVRGSPVPKKEGVLGCVIPPVAQLMDWPASKNKMNRRRKIILYYETILYSLDTLMNNSCYSSFKIPIINYTKALIFL